MRCRLAEDAPGRTLGYAEKQQRNIASMRDEKVEPNTAEVRTHDDTEERTVIKKSGETIGKTNPMRHQEAKEPCLKTLKSDVRVKDQTIKIESKRLPWTRGAQPLNL